MQRRRFIRESAAVLAVLPLIGIETRAASADDWFVKQAAANTFAPDDTLVQRLEKLNILMGTDYKIRAYYPKEWDTAAWNKPGPNHLDENYLLAATSERLDHRPKQEWTWGVYLERNGKQWTGKMNPVEYLHWTAQVALGYRLAKVQQG